MADEKTLARLQVALDFVELDRALKVAEEAAAGGADILEAGTPLIKSVGLESVRRLRALFPKLVIAADMKVMDAGRMEVESAAKAGAKIVHVLAAAPDATIAECVAAGRGDGAGSGADRLGARERGAAVVMVGGAVTKAVDARKATEDLKRAIMERVSIPTRFFKRVTEDKIREILMQISAANLS